MKNLLRADFARLGRSAAFWRALIGMLALASAFMVMQATAMDYTVPLSRVIFLPMSLYGIAMAAFVSTFIGADFGGGFIRNKLLTAGSRGAVVISSMIVSGAACLAVYMLVTAFTAGAGRFFFENNVEPADFLRLFALGAGMSLATGSLFAAVAMICSNPSRGALWCVGLACGMLFLCLHTNEILVQPEYRDGVLNPHYVGGFRRALCGVLHDLNPCGQAAQLSAWEVWHPVRALLFSVMTVVVSATAGCGLFCGKDIE